MDSTLRPEAGRTQESRNLRAVVWRNSVLLIALLCLLFLWSLSITNQQKAKTPCAMCIIIIRSGGRCVARFLAPFLRIVLTCPPLWQFPVSVRLLSTSQLSLDCCCDPYDVCWWGEINVYYDYYVLSSACNLGLKMAWLWLGQEEYSANQIYYNYL